jgi:hypothetical protein
MIWANLGNSTEGGSKGRALTKWKRNGCARPSLTNLQKPLRSETSHWVDYWHCLPPENPAGHRKAYRRIAKVHHSHEIPPSSASITCRGGTT